MKKEYQKPDVELISLIAKEDIANGENLDEANETFAPDVESSIFD